jgi:hypothetical protein
VGARWWLVAPLSVLSFGCGCAKSGKTAPARAREAGAAFAAAPVPVRVAAPVPAQPPTVARPTEADFGLPFYPGSVVDEESVQSVQMGAYYQRHASFATEASPEKVAAFYRAKLAALAPDKDAFIETRVADKTTLILKRDARNLSLVAIEPREGAAGSDIQLTATGAGQAGGAGLPGAAK